MSELDFQKAYTNLDTAYGYDIYHVGFDGFPVREHSWYTIRFETNWTLCKDISASVVGEDGNPIWIAKLKGGDKVVYYCADGETWRR